MQFVERSRGSFEFAATVLLVLAACLEAGCGTFREPDIGSEQFLYVGNQQQNTISAYRVNNTGVLTRMSASPMALGGNTLIADPNRKILFSFGLNADAIEP